MNQKFRAWHKEKYIMMEVSELIFYSCELYEIKCDWSETRKNRNYCGNKNCHSDCGQEFLTEDFCHEDVPLDQVELMQWTGLKDKNGVDLYEGDIIVFYPPWGSHAHLVERHKHNHNLVLTELYRRTLDPNDYEELDEINSENGIIEGNRWHCPELLIGYELDDK